MRNGQEPDATLDAALDAALAQWGRHDAGDPAAALRIVRHADAITASTTTASTTAWSGEPQPIAPGRPGKDRRWLSFAMGGSAIAASLAIALMGMPRAGMPSGPSGAEAPAVSNATGEQGMIELAAADDEVDSFAMLFTLTAEEEQYL